MKKRMLALGLLLFVATGLSGCALGWFGAGAATGAVVEHQYDEHKK
jgi:hypothetical protein